MRRYANEKIHALSSADKINVPFIICFHYEMGKAIVNRGSDFFYKTKEAFQRIEVNLNAKDNNESRVAITNKQAAVL